MTKSDALAAHVLLRTRKLEHLFARIVSCHVVFELAGHHHRHGDRYRVTINLALPGAALLVDYPPSDEHFAVTAKAAVDRAFDEEERQLEHWVRRQRADRRDKVPSSRGT
jgi:ribosome-associated translation inhibitor RaiA